MEKEIVKHYSNGELTVVWKPKKCIHAAECVKALPEVYDPKARPWIRAENASTEALKAQIAKCPSGALSFIGEEDNDADSPPASAVTKVQVLANGPLLVHGSLSVVDKDGNESAKSNTTAFCRCGHSQNKPYCDGSHVKAGFKD